MDSLSDLGIGMAQGLAFGAAAIAMLVLGFFVIDVITPGKLPKLIWEDRNINATIVTASGLFGVGLIVTVSILTSHDDFVTGILDTLGYGVLGILLMAVAFKVTDLCTPGDLGATVVEERFHPAAVITAVVKVVVGMAIAAAIS